MADIHPIRLRGPWQYTVVDSYPVSAGRERVEEQSALADGKLNMPSDWGSTLGEAFRGRVRYTRRFGCPTALEPHESVYLVLEAVDARGELELNGVSLGSIAWATGPVRLEVTPLLRERNELTVMVELPCYESAAEERASRGPRLGQPGGLIGETRLEIQTGR